MAEHSEQWKNCIAELLEAHGLKPRTAEQFANNAASESAIYQWKTNGVLPTDKKAKAFLRAFPITEAIKCMKAGGYAVPEEWYAELQEKQDPVDAVIVCLRSSKKELSDTAIEQVRAFMEKIIRQENGAKETGKM